MQGILQTCGDAAPGCVRYKVVRSLWLGWMTVSFDWQWNKTLFGPNPFAVGDSAAIFFFFFCEGSVCSEGIRTVPLHCGTAHGTKDCLNRIRLQQVILQWVFCCRCFSSWGKRSFWRNQDSSTAPWNCPFAGRDQWRIQGASLMPGMSERSRCAVLE